MEMKEVQVTLSEYKGIAVTRRAVTVTKEEVAQEMERARSYASTTVDKTSGQAEMGDQAVIDFVGYMDGEPFEGGDGTDYPLVLGSNTFIPGFEAQLVGARVGDIVDVKVPFPTNYHAKEYAGRDALFKVTIKGLRATITPELSDEVVSKISPCKTVDEFEAYVESEIKKFKADQILQAREEEVLTKIVESSTLEIPQERIDQYAEALKNNLLGQLRNSGATLEQYLDYNNLTEEMLDEHLSQNGLIMLKGKSVLLAIAEAEGFTYTEEELEELLFVMARNYQTTVKDLKNMLGEDGLKQAAEEILQKKALSFITEQSIEE